jgi:hypothetical protein
MRVISGGAATEMSTATAPRAKVNININLVKSERSSNKGYEIHSTNFQKDVGLNQMYAIEKL